MSTSCEALDALHGANYVVEFTAVALLKCEVADAFWDNVVLLMGFDGLNGSTGAPGFTDESSREHGTASVPFGAHIDTSDSKFGSSSLRAVGDSFAAVFSPSHDFWLSTSNSDAFTIECWVKFSNIAAHDPNVIVGNSFVDVDWHFGVTAAGEMRFGFHPGGGGASVAIISSGASIATGNWYFLAVDKDSSGKIRLYRNGVMVGSATPADSSFETEDGSGLDIGATGLVGAFALNGWIDELRITKGVARYASDAGFSVPTGAFPRA
ncbi:hypothetical protein ACVIW2_001458 [Bradyrhizobium huanghuaihaiense]